MQQPQQTTKQRVILFGFVAAAILISVAVHYGTQKIKKQRMEDEINRSSSMRFQLPDSSEFLGILMITSRSSVTVITEYGGSDVCGLGHDEKKKWHVVLGDNEQAREKHIEAPAEDFHVYFVLDQKIARAVPYAELGIPEIAETKKNATEDKSWDGVYFDLISDKIKAYLETHAEEIYGAEAAAD